MEPIQQKENNQNTGCTNGFYCYSCSKTFNVSVDSDFDYMCIECGGEFLEELDQEDDPRNFSPFENDNNQQNANTNTENSNSSQSNNVPNPRVNTNSENGNGQNSIPNIQNSQASNMIQDF